MLVPFRTVYARTCLSAIESLSDRNRSIGAATVFIARKHTIAFREIAYALVRKSAFREGEKVLSVSLKLNPLDGIFE